MWIPHYRTLAALSTFAGLSTLAVLIVAQPVAAHGKKEVDTRAAGHPPLEAPRKLESPNMDAVEGKRIFINKGCITCHGLNGVGGMDGPQIDAHVMSPVMNAYDFAARMWNHAQGMVAVQINALGEQITLTGAEMAHIAAFLHSDPVQHTVTEDDIPPRIRALMHHAHEGEEKGHMDEPGHAGTPHGHMEPKHMD